MAALDQSSVERDAWVRQQCGEDGELLDEVRWLVAAAEDDDADEVPEQFQQATEQALRQVSLQVPLPRDYRLIRRISQGGMGIVYLAERIDGEMRQRVALKLLHVTGSPDEELRQQFATEQQILSRFTHPNIARLIDAGMTSEGRPFMATEYVDGEPIDRWCRHRDSALNERLKLFLQVCDAVDYAHRHMVIHRDLKPGNILVSKEGEPKLLDFGIARLVDGTDGVSDAPSADSTQGNALTLAYASPEQVAGRDLGVASDVYSLGVVLYELLAGVGPFADSGSPEQQRAAILAGEFVPPANVQSQSVGRIPRDLEAIVLKAMRSDPEHRYESVRALTSDVKRFLAHRPVQAHRAGTFYRVGRFVRRHHLAVVVSVLVLALLAGFLLDREAQLRRIAWERDRAEAVTDFIDELFAGADSLPSRGNEVTVRELLDVGADQLRDTDHYGPAVLGSLYLALGRAYNGLGLGEQALPLLREAQTALGDGISLHERALVQAEIGAALDTAGRAVEAIEADQRALDLFQRSSEGPERTLLGIRIRQLRNHANVLDMPLEETVAQLEDILYELDSRPGEVAELRFQALTALASAHVFGRRAEEAMGHARQARELGEVLYEHQDPRRLRGRYAYANALLLSDPEAAVEAFAELVADHERLIGPSQRLANMIGNYGVALSRTGRDRDSMEAFGRAASMIEDLVGRDHYLYRLSQSNLAASHLRLGEPEQAEALVREVLEAQEWPMEEGSGVEIMYRASALDVLGAALARQGRLEEAAQAYETALDMLDANADSTWSELRATAASRLAELRQEP